MGYYTKYTLTWDGPQEVETQTWKEIAKELGEARAQQVLDRELLVQITKTESLIAEWLRENKDAGYVLRPDGTSEDSAKWYSHEKDVAALSRMYPDVTFTLHGEGEETEDIWKKYFKGGRMQTAVAKITIPPCDPNGKWSEVKK